MYPATLLTALCAFTSLVAALPTLILADVTQLQQRIADYAPPVAGVSPGPYEDMIGVRFTSRNPDEDADEEFVEEHFFMPIGETIIARESSIPRPDSRDQKADEVDRRESRSALGAGHD